jgi:hypothetical protein
VLTRKSKAFFKIIFDTYRMCKGSSSSSSSEEMTIARVFLTGATAGDDEVDEID